MDMTEMLWSKVLFIRSVFLNQMFLSVLTLLLGVIVALLVCRITKSQAVSKKSLSQSFPKPKNLSRRICDIPEHITKEELQRQLGLEPHHGEDDLRLTFARSSRRFCMATITSYEALKLEYPVDTSFIGITPLFESSNANVDILFLPGLGSHALGGFKSKESNNVWLRDFLPEDIPTARVLIYGYDTIITKGDVNHSITDLGMAFLDSIRAFRAATNTRRRPIIFVGHSLGGLLVKAALSIAYDGQDDEPNSDFFNASYGLIFFGVPNLGLKLGNLKEITAGQLNEQLIHDLEVNKDSEATPFLQELKTKFTRVCYNQDPEFNIITYYERKQTRTVEKLPNGILSRTGPLCFVVTRESACRIGIEDNFHKQIPLDLDHSNLVKFSSRSDDVYGRVLDRMKELVEKAPSVVNSRFSLKKELSSSEIKHWRDLNVPDYKGFKESEKVANPSEGTLQWLVAESKDNLPLDPESLQKEHFELWRDSINSSPLLVCGAPGQGKSVLSNFVIEHLKDFNKTLRKHKIIYYFCNIKNEESQWTASSILRALIVQLCEDRRIYENLPNRFQEKSEIFHKAHFSELWSTFEHLATTLYVYNRIYCVLDGLDVYQTDMENLLVNMKKLFKFTSMIQAGRPVLKLFCTSRPIKDVLCIKIEPCKILRASSEDLRLFVQTRLEQFQHFGCVEFIQHEVERRTDRTFLWVSIVLRRLEEIEVPSDYEIKKVVNDSPAELQELYKDLIRKAFKKHKAFALILAWITFAKRPLSLEELEAAIAIGMTDRKICWQDCLEHKIPLSSKYIREHLGTLVDVVDDSPFLIHQSLRDFLLGTELWQESPVISNFKPPELLLADSCMSFLAFKELKVNDKLLDIDLKLHPFFQYTSNFWDTHIHTQEEAQRYLRLLEIILKWPIRIHWIMERERYIKNVPWSLSKIAIRFDIDWLANILLNKISSSLIETFDNSWLVEAVEEASLRVLKQLLSHPEIERIKVTKEVITAAAGSGWNGEEMVTLLLQERGSEFKITEEVIKAAAGNSNGEKVVRLLLQERGSEFKITEEVVQAAAGNLSGEKMMRLLLQERGSEFKITEEVVNAAANNWKGNEVMRLLLQERGSDFKITEEVVKAVAGNPHCGIEVMTLLLQERGSEFKITEEVIKAAAGNSNGEKVVRLLLQERGSEFKITEKVVKAAVQNWNGEEIMRLLLQERGSEFKITEEVASVIANRFVANIMSLVLQEHRIEFKITEKVVRAAANNRKSGKEVMELLLQKRGSEFKITEEVVKAAIWNSNEEVIALLLRERGSEFKITEEVVEAAASDPNTEKVMRLLLQERGSEFKITEEVAKAAAGNSRNGIEVMALLLQERGSEFEITEEVAKAAAGNSNGEKVMRLLLQERGSEFKITEEVIQAAIWSSNEEVLALLLRERGSEFKITEEVVEAAIWNSNEEVLALLLRERGSEFKITEEVVKAVAGDLDCDIKMITLLLQERGSEFKITEEVVKAAAGNSNCGIEVMTWLLQERGSEFKITEEVAKAAAGNSEYGVEVMALLLQERGSEFKITEEVAEAAIWNSNYGVEVMALLLQERGSEFKIIEEVVKAAAGNLNTERKMILLLQERGSEFKITEEVVQVAAGSFNGGNVVRLLLQERGSEFKITEEVIKAAASNSNGGIEVMTLLLQERGSEFKITEEVVKAVAAGDWSGEKMMRLLLQERGSEFKITEEVVKAAAGNSNGEKMMRLLLQERGSKFKITEKVVQAAAGNSNGEKMMRLLLQERGSEFKITEEVIKAAAGNSNGEKVVRLLLQERGSEFKITEEVVQAAAGNSNGEKMMRLLLQERGSKFKITEKVVQAAAGNSNGEKMMRLLLQERGSEFKITEEVIKAAAGNSNGEKVVRLLLQERGSEFKITEEVVQAAAGNSNGEKMMRLLLQERGSEFKITEEVIKAAAGNSNGEKVVRLLLQERGSEFKITEEVVQAAAGNSNGEKMMRLLLQERGSEFKITEEVITAAATNGQIEVLYLCKQRSGTDISSWVPIAQLYNALKTGDEKVAQTLLSQGVDPNLKDNQGRTLLWWSVEEGHTSVTNMLLERNVQLNEADCYGWTPLHIAAASGQLSTVRLLLCQDRINLDLEDATGLTALAQATENGYTDVANILRGHAKLKEKSL